jgi:hypothetical protein
MTLTEKTFGKDVTTRTWDRVQKVSRAQASLAAPPDRLATSLYRALQDVHGYRSVLRRSRTAAARSSSMGTVSSQPMQPSVMLCP